MKLNLGCGFNKREDYINVDCNEYCMPDIEVDLDKTEWPWGDDSVDAVDLTHTLEHLGETTAEFFHVMKERLQGVQVRHSHRHSCSSPNAPCFYGRSDACTTYHT